MKKILFLLCACSSGLFAQQPKNYFQQEVNYKISAVLNDSLHTLSAHIEIEYVNHSPDSLTQIWMHLWGNAFKNRRSAFCKQKLRDGDGEFYFSEDEDRGRYRNLDFMCNGQKINWSYDPKHPDIAILSLPTTLPPGEKILISTPFLLKIPASFSRLGHVETSYQMTQWYPKPAVFDHKGWHAMPYLDIGEFYSEFGSFDVTLTLPENYVVGATGTLQTPSEIEFLRKREIESKAILANPPSQADESFPASSRKMKTIRYTAEQVHDFAWFADKRFLVVKDTARLESGRQVECWAMFPSSKKSPGFAASQSSLWERGAFYVRRAVEFYSENVGEYPYPQATAVHSALSAGGGMEYPMITVIGDAASAKGLDEVITHEVGHNWFYGILASNERDHPFMDEGLNSYYEHRYMRKYYVNHSPFELPRFILNEAKQGSLLEAGYLVLAREKEDTPPDTHSNLFTPIAYGLQVYMKTALYLLWLEKAVGTSLFDKAMQDYYRRWQFRHPYPEDFREVLEENQLNVDWFFEAMQSQKQADYKLMKIKEKGSGNYQLIIKNKGDLQAPFSVTALKKGQLLRTEWFSPAQGSKRQMLEFQADSADAFEIDWERHTLDLNRKNNFRRSAGLFPGMRPFEFRPLAIFQNSRRNTLAALPWLGWNNYDKTILGLVVYNPPIPLRKIQYYILPGYAIGSKKWVGLADVKLNFRPNGLISKIECGVSAKSFDFDFNARDEYYLRFWRIVPQLRLELRSPSLSFQQSLQIRTLWVGRESAVYDSAGVFSGTPWRNNHIHEIGYEARQEALPNPFRLRFGLETQAYRDNFDQAAHYWKGTAEWRQKFYYGEKKKVMLRLFAGYFFQTTQRQRNIDEYSLSLNPQGFNDYKFDQTFLARSDADNILGRQVSQTGGGFKSAFGQASAANIGHSNNFVFSLNLKADLPKRLPLGIPIKPYFDLGYFDDATPLGETRPKREQLLWSGGLMLEFFKGGLEIYFPLASSKNLKDLYCEQAGGTNPSALFCGGNYWKMISWSMRLHFSDPVKMVEDMVR